MHFSAVVRAPALRRSRLSRMAVALLGGLALWLDAGAASAQGGLLDEVWVGGFAHDISDSGGAKESDTADIELEIDSTRPAVLRFLGAPRVNGVIMINSAGLSSFVAAGLVWDHALIGRLHGSVDFGLAATNGVTDPPPGAEGVYLRDHRLLVGSTVLFHEALGLDWRLSDRWSIGAQFVHLSNGMILAHHFNEGITDAGLRLGYRFR